MSDDYLTSKEVLRKLPYFSYSSMMKHAKENWRCKKVGKLWMFHKDDVAYPNWPVADWQVMIFKSISIDTPDGILYHEAKELIYKTLNVDNHTAGFCSPNLYGVFLWSNEHTLAYGFIKANGAGNIIIPIICDMKEYPNFMKMIEAGFLTAAELLQQTAV